MKQEAFNNDTLRVAIVEDDEGFAGQIGEYLTRFAHENGRVIRSEHFCDGQAFLDSDISRFGLVLMDIEMPRLGGMEAARQLREANDEVLLIFITSLSQYAHKGYEVSAMDYVLKPLAYADFAMKLQKVFLRLPAVEHRIAIGGRGSQRYVSVREILYIETRGHIFIYHIARESIECDERRSLRALEEELRPYGFARANASELVGLRHIIGIRGNIISLSETEIEISRTMREPFLTALLQFEEGI